MANETSRIPHDSIADCQSLPFCYGVPRGVRFGAPWSSLKQKRCCRSGTMLGLEGQESFDLKASAKSLVIRATTQDVSLTAEHTW